MDIKTTFFCLFLVEVCFLLSCNNTSKDSAPTTPTDPPEPGFPSSMYLPLNLDNHWNYNYDYQYRKYDANYQLTQSYDHNTSLGLIVVKEPHGYGTNDYWHVDVNYTPFYPPGLSHPTPELRGGIDLDSRIGNVYEHPGWVYIIGDDMTMIGDAPITSLLLDGNPFSYVGEVPEITVPAGTFYNVRKMEFYDSWSYEGAEHYYYQYWEYCDYYAENVGLIYSSYHFHDYSSNDHTYDEFTDIVLESYELKE